MDEKRSEQISRVTAFFMPGQDKLQDISIRDKIKLPHAINGTLSVSMGMLVFSVMLLFMGKFVVGGFVTAALVFFGVSLFLIKNGKVVISGLCSSAGLLVATAVIFFVAAFEPHPLIGYRNAFFLVVMAVINQFNSLRKRQIVTFAIAGLGIWIAFWLSLGQAIIRVAVKPAIVSIGVNTLAIVIANLFLLLNLRYNERVTGHAESEELKARLTLEKIRSAYEKSRKGLDIGQRLLNSTDSAISNLSQIDGLTKSLVEEAQTLNTETSTVKQSGDQVAAKAERMKKSVESQNSALERTSDEIGKISLNIENISSIAQRQHEGMDRMMQSLNNQQSLLGQLVAQVDEVGRSSEGIAVFVNTIDTISNQTNLLAMNASIEAAHAGEYGKGFSVIAQEIRKLSNETNSSAQKISESLAQNTETVKTAVESAKSFSVYMAQSSQDFKNSIEALENILHGVSEINLNAQEIMRSIQNVTGSSQANYSLVEGVATGIDSQKYSLASVSDFAETLRESVRRLEGLLSSTINSVRDIQVEARENTQVSGLIADSMKL